MRRRLRPPRRLKTTRDGKWLIAITIFTGLAALNTGNNLLFFGWGLLLASVILSGVLSEATLRVIRAQARAGGELRANERGAVDVRLSNVGRRLPAFGLEAMATLRDDTGKLIEGEARYHLRLDPKADEEVWARLQPRRRGVHRVEKLSVATRYPFGFFIKSRDFLLEPPLEVTVFPRRAPVGRLPEQLLARLGSMPTRRPGAGDEFFSLRPYREGDDLRRVHWRRSARSDRLFTKETESEASRQILVELLATPRTCVPADLEEAIAVCGSLVEDLLARGQSVAVRAPGVSLAPARGSRQRLAVLNALALLDPSAPLLPARIGPGAARVVVVGREQDAPADVAFVVRPGAGSSDLLNVPSGEAHTPVLSTVAA